MDQVMQSLHELQGVRATLVLDSTGQVLRHRAHAVYDPSLLQQMTRLVVKALESIQLQQADWNSITACFDDGRLLLRKLTTVAGKSYFLGLVADGALNPAFATVAIRVAVSKLKSIIDSGGVGAAPAVSMAGGHSSPQATGSASGPTRTSSPDLAESGQSWSGLSSSSVGRSGVTAADEASATFLSRVAKSLALSTGPMAKVFVKEAVRKLNPAGQFSMDMAQALVNELEKQIASPSDRASFRKAVGMG